jgi:cobalt transporter subunit CbtB
MTTRTISSASVSASSRLLLGVACFMLGAFLVYGVGLAQDANLHNAAHDTRHAIGFPCH